MSARSSRAVARTRVVAATRVRPAAPNFWIAAARVFEVLAGLPDDAARLRVIEAAAILLQCRVIRL